MATQRNSLRYFSGPEFSTESVSLPAAGEAIDSAFVVLRAPRCALRRRKFSRKAAASRSLFAVFAAPSPFGGGSPALGSDTIASQARTSQGRRAAGIRRCDLEVSARSISPAGAHLIKQCHCRFLLGFHRQADKLGSRNSC
ncbi:MAG: hypothetical protein ACYC5H_17570 [Methylovirgula sp.]